LMRKGIFDWLAGLGGAGLFAFWLVGLLREGVSG
jgi:hypothetical protein